MKKLSLTAVLLAAVICLSACSFTNNILGALESISDELSSELNELNNDELNNFNANSNTEDPDVVEKDEEGHIIKLSHYDGNGKLVFVHTQKWENGRIVNKTSYNSKGNQTGSIDYEYDDHGNATVMAWFFWNTGNLMRVERVYDEYDRLIEDTGYGTENVSTNKTYLEYDDKDGQHPKNYCKKIYYPSWPGDRYYVTTLEYDADGLLSKTTTVDKDGNLTSYTIYTNENAKLMEYTSYDAEGKPQYTYKYIYDENGKKLREERYNSEGKLEGIDY